MSETEVLILVLSLEGLLFVAIGSAMRSVSRNRLVGIRTPATLADDRVWRETHALWAPRFAWLGVAILVSGLGAIALPLPGAVTLGVHLAVLLGGLAWVTVGAWRFSSRRLAFYRREDRRLGRE